jgi:hypothetical protein
MELHGGRYENVVREKEDLASKLDVSGGAPLEQKYQVRADTCPWGRPPPVCATSARP